MTPRVGAPLGALLASLILVAVASGDGGELRLRERAGEVVLSVWTAPAPLRVGAAEVFVVVEPSGERTPEPARIEVELWSGGERIAAADAVPSEASGRAGGRATYVAVMALREAGEAELRIRRAAAAVPSDHRVAVAVEPPLSPLREHGIALGLPFVAIALFALAERRRLSRGPVGSSGQST